jgi:hypothetical protein
MGGYHWRNCDPGLVGFDDIERAYNSLSARIDKVAHSPGITEQIREMLGIELKRAMVSDALAEVQNLQSANPNVTTPPQAVLDKLEHIRPQIAALEAKAITAMMKSPTAAAPLPSTAVPSAVVMSTPSAPPPTTTAAIPPQGNPFPPDILPTAIPPQGNPFPPENMNAPAAPQQYQSQSQSQYQYQYQPHEQFLMYGQQQQQPQPQQQYYWDPNLFAQYQYQYQSQYHYPYQYEIQPQLQPQPQAYHGYDPYSGFYG